MALISWFLQLWVVIDAIVFAVVWLSSIPYFLRLCVGVIGAVIFAVVCAVIDMYFFTCVLFCV